MKQINKDLEKYYNDALENFGPGARGVGWKSEMTQENRFAQLAKIIKEKEDFSINDLGCGTGDLLAYLGNNSFKNFIYTGYDVMESMVDLSKETHKNSANASFKKINPGQDMDMADYSVASGIFNLKYAIDEKAWMEYILQTVEMMDRCSKHGFAFNMLTKYSDREFMLDTLYYGDPLVFFDHCKRNYSRNVALLHDYNEYDFTILVRK